MRALQIVFFALGVAGSAAAQTPAAKAAEPPTTPPPASASEAYTFRPDGRRDPFVSVIGGPLDQPAVTKRGQGAAAFGVGEISVRGIMQSREAMIAMVQGPDNKTYLIHQGDKFADGIVKSVTSQGLVVVQEINDPLSAQKQREVRKLLRSLEDEKQ